MYAASASFGPVLLSGVVGLIGHNVEVGRNAARCRAGDGDQRSHRRPDIARGKVKFFNSQMGFGFMMPNKGRADVPCIFSRSSASERVRSMGGKRLTCDVVSEVRQAGRFKSSSGRPSSHRTDLYRG